MPDIAAACGMPRQGRPELLSMFACFAGDRGLRDSDFECCIPDKAKACQAFYKKHGLEPCPAVAFSSAFAKEYY